jgi:hypothetical protein
MKNGCLFIVLLFLFTSCNKKRDPNEVYISEFKWSIHIPSTFSTEDINKWKEVQKKGMSAVETEVGREINSVVRTLFIFTDDKQNYFEATTQPYDMARDGDYVQTCERMNDLIYRTITTQMPTARFDTIKSTQMIDNILFQKLEGTTTYADNSKRTSLIYRSLFDTKEITISIMFMDDKAGRQMEDALLRSSFGKK